MRRRNIGFACLILLQLAATSPSQPPNASPAPEMVDDQQAIEIVAKRLCKTEPIVGTRIPVARKCETPAQLRQYAAQAREMIESYRQRSPCLMGMSSGEGKAMPC